MNSRIEASIYKATQIINAITVTENKPWDKKQILEEWEIKKADHLNSKDCKCINMLYYNR